jgi:hypothetical protein
LVVVQRQKSIQETFEQVRVLSEYFFESEVVFWIKITHVFLFFYKDRDFLENVCIWECENLDMNFRFVFIGGCVAVGIVKIIILSDISVLEFLHSQRKFKNFQ